MSPFLAGEWWQKRKSDEFIITTLSRVPLQHSRAAAPSHTRVLYRNHPSIIRVEKEVVYMAPKRPILIRDIIFTPTLIRTIDVQQQQQGLSL
jgi:hypothetical protein